MTYKLTVNIPENRKVLLELPFGVPVGEAEIIVNSGERNKSKQESVTSLCGSLKGSRFTSARFMEHKKTEKEIEN
jgi:hypothetical protein